MNGTAAVEPGRAGDSGLVHLFTSKTVTFGNVLLIRQSVEVTGAPLLMRCQDLAEGGEHDHVVASARNCWPYLVRDALAVLAQTIAPGPLGPRGISLLDHASCSPAR